MEIMANVYTSAQVAELLGYTHDVLLVLRKRYSLGHKVGGRWKYSSNDISEFKRHQGNIGTNKHLRVEKNKD